MQLHPLTQTKKVFARGAAQHAARAKAGLLRKHCSRRSYKVAPIVCNNLDVQVPQAAQPTCVVIGHVHEPARKLHVNITVAQRRDLATAAHKPVCSQPTLQENIHRLPRN